jgi:hypothetical protein
MISVRILLVILGLASLGNNVMAQNNAPQIILIPGGRVITFLGNSQPLPLDSPQENTVNHFAVADEGYHFAGWQNGCSTTVGLLCTQALGLHHEISARFSKTSVPKVAAKVTLLLQDKPNNPSIWNELAGRFQHHCPEIYGGVILGDGPIKPNDLGYCYRLRLGYYDALSDNRNSQELEQHSDATTHEINAALASIVDRHQKVNMTLVTQGNMTIAVSRALLNNPIINLGSVDLVTLETKKVIRQPASQQKANTTQANDILNIITLHATPDQVAKITKILAYLSNARWQPE